MKNFSAMPIACFGERLLTSPYICQSICFQSSSSLLRHVKASHRSSFLSWFSSQGGGSTLTARDLALSAWFHLVTKGGGGWEGEGELRQVSGHVYDA